MGFMKTIFGSKKFSKGQSSGHDEDMPPRGGSPSTNFNGLSLSSPRQSSEFTPITPIPAIPLRSAPAPHYEIEPSQAQYVDTTPFPVDYPQQYGGGQYIEGTQSSHYGLPAGSTYGQPTLQYPVNDWGYSEWSSNPIPHQEGAPILLPYSPPHPASSTSWYQPPQQPHYQHQQLEPYQPVEPLSVVPPSPTIESVDDSDDESSTAIPVDYPSSSHQGRRPMQHQRSQSGLFSRLRSNFSGQSSRQSDRSEHTEVPRTQSSILREMSDEYEVHGHRGRGTAVYQSSSDEVLAYTPPARTPPGVIEISSSSSDFIWSESSDSVTIQPPPIPVQFPYQQQHQRGAQQTVAYRRSRFLNVPVATTRFIDVPALQQLGIIEDVFRLCTRTGAGILCTMDEETYVELTKEFVYTFQYDATERESQYCISFSLCGQRFDMSLADFGLHFGMYETADIEANKILLQKLWALLSKQPFPAKMSRFKVNSIHPPAVRYFVRLLTSTFFSKPEANYFAKTECELLYAFFNPSLGPFYQPNLPHLVASHWLRIIQQSQVPAQICFGGCVTKLAKRLVPNFDASQFTIAGVVQPGNEHHHLSLNYMLSKVKWIKQWRKKFQERGAMQWRLYDPDGDTFSYVFGDEQFLAIHPLTRHFQDYKLDSRPPYGN